MTEIDGQSARVSSHDRRTALIVVGVLLIVLGCGAGLMVPLVLLGQVLAGQVQGVEPTPMRMLAPGLASYAGLAVAFVWLGIGSIRCRRWARSLVLVIAWVWLFSGIIGTAATAMLLPGTLAHPPGGGPPLPAGAYLAVMIFALVFVTVLMVVLPGGLVLFFSSRQVRATCEARDPVPRWTDACPLPVLGISLMLGFGAVSAPLVLPMYRGVVPFFGWYVDGLAGVAITLLTAAAAAWAARETYRVRVAGWWVALAFLAFWMLSTTVTVARGGLVAMYERMGFPEAELEMVRQVPILQHPALWLLLLACWLPVLLYLLWARKLFRS